MEKNIIWGSLRFFVSCLKNLPVSGSLSLGNNGFCVSTGTLSENFVYFPESVVAPEIAEAAVRFFRERGQEAMWFLYGEDDGTLEAAGLYREDDLTAMTLDTRGRSIESGSGVRVERVVTREEAGLWAETASRGFGEDGTPENYYKFVEAMSEEGENIGLYLAKLGGECAGTFLVTHEAETMGVYYFAVVPELRRQGVARGMMDEICRLSGGKRLVLQATTIGEKFYRAYGFEELFKIPLYYVK